MNNSLPMTFVIGMPRSGSTLFTRLLNQTGDLFIINDFYYLQYVDALDGFTQNDETTNSKLAQYILDMIKARIDRPDSPTINCGLKLSPQDEQRVENFVNQLDYENQKNWSSILQEIMRFCADLSGKSTWGYNTPQDYLNIDILQQVYPHAKFIFVMRDPRSMLRSYKYIFANVSNTTKRYHPILQSIAWRTSVRSYLKYKGENSDKFLLIRYEDLVDKTQETLAKVSEFIKTKFCNTDLSQLGNNSSFKYKDKSMQTISDTEIWLCEKLAGKEMQQFGYQLSETKPRLLDFATIASVTLKAGSFYTSKIFTSGNIRKRVFNLIKQV